jgi:hypothetical protein
MLIFHLKVAQPPELRVTPVRAHNHVRAHLEGLLPAPQALHPDDGAVVLNQAGDVCAHPTLKTGERGGLLHQGAQENRLRHPYRIRILRHNRRELKAANVRAVHTDQPLRQLGVGLGKDIAQEPEFVEQVGRTRLQDFAPKLALEALVAFQDEHVDPATR